MPPRKVNELRPVVRRSSEQLTFLKRCQVFLHELEMRTFPNASKLAELCGCSRSTAMRTIDTLRREFGAPIEYDESNRGYWLSDPTYRFASPPHTRGEIIALLLASKLSEALGDSLLSGSLRTLVDKITLGRHDLMAIRRDLPKFLAIAPLHKRPTTASSIEALSLCLDGVPVRLTIPCDSTGEIKETLTAIPKQLIIKDFSSFLVVECTGGKILTIPAQFVRSSCTVETTNNA